VVADDDVLIDPKHCRYRVQRTLAAAEKARPESACSELHDNTGVRRYARTNGRRLATDAKIEKSREARAETRVIGRSDALAQFPLGNTSARYRVRSNAFWNFVIESEFTGTSPRTPCCSEFRRETVDHAVTRLSNFELAVAGEPAHVEAGDNVSIESFDAAGD